MLSETQIGMISLDYRHGASPLQFDWAHRERPDHARCRVSFVGNDRKFGGKPLWALRSKRHIDRTGFVCDDWFAARIARNKRRFAVTVDQNLVDAQRNLSGISQHDLMGGG